MTKISYRGGISLTVVVGTDKDPTAHDDTQIKVPVAFMSSIWITQRSN